ncbi:hypothetical protein BDW22DRAFT_379833 [Trametopsis cervina]|nr:hypothetical protein BDW22DRAFT_379833 [Trametopsis cervina]
MLGNMKFDLPATPAMDYFSSEDMPLLGDFLRRNMSDQKRFAHLHHGHTDHFDVAEFPDTPMLPDCSDDEFSDFIESPGSEVPPTMDAQDQTEVQHASEGTLRDLPTAEYIQHVAIIVLVQLLIPIPFMLPMGLNFTKRALKVFLPGFALSILGHSLIHILNQPTDVPLLSHVHNSIADPSFILSALYAQLKIGILGGFVVGAVMSHVLNFCILAHTVCRLVRGLEPQPTAMRRAMDASKMFQFLQTLALDLVTGAAMLSAGAAARDWFYGAQFGVSGLPTDKWHAAAIGIIGTLAVHAYMATYGQAARVHRAVPLSKKLD